MMPDRTAPSYIPAEMPAAAGLVHPVATGQLTLGESMGPALDEICQIATDLGIRPYRVFLVHWAWPKTKGIGAPVEISRREILPTPKVADMNGIPFSLAAVGLTEMGGIMLSKVSQRFSEDDLTGRTPDLRDPAHPVTSLGNVEFFYEVVEARRTDPPTKPRRFVPSGVPMLYRAGMEWRLALTTQDYTYDPAKVALNKSWSS